MTNTLAAYASTVKPVGFAPRLVTGFYCDVSNPAAVREVELSNGRIGFQVGPMGVIYASKAVAITKASERREKMEAARLEAEQVAALAKAEAARLEAESVARLASAVPSYDAASWADSILSELASVSTTEQKNHARYLLCDDYLSGKTVSNVGPSLESLRSIKAALTGPIGVVRPNNRRKVQTRHTRALDARRQAISA